MRWIVFRCILPSAWLLACCVQAAEPVGLPLLGEPVAVPGGVEALATFLDGVSPDDPRMLVAVNRRLLRVVRADGDITRMRDRADLLRYLDAIESLRRQFPFPIIVERHRLQDPMLERLAGRLGFRLTRGPNGAWSVDAPGTEAATFGRRVAAALGWRVAEWVGLRDDEILELRIREDHTPFPMPLDLASSVTRRPVKASNALRTMAGDLSLGLLVEGRWALAPQIRQRADADVWRRLYREAPIRFHRYGPSLGALLSEGPRQPRPWDRTAAAHSAAAPHPWLEAVGFGRPERAFLRQSFEHLPVDVRGLWERAWEIAEPTEKEVWVAALLTSVRSLQGDAVFTRARGDGATLALRWWIAAETTAAEDAMEAVVRTPWLPLEARTRIPLRRALQWGLGSRLAREPAAPILMNALAEVPEVPDVRLLGLAEVVGRLSRDGVRPLGEARLSLFQAGWVLLHRLRESGRLSAEQTRDASVRWIEIHRRAPASAAALGRAAAWWRERLEAVQAPPGWPGRDALERSWLYASFAASEPGRFPWRGLRLQDDRPVQLALRSIELLEEADLPSWGELLRVFDAAAGAGSGAEPRAALGRLLEAVTDRDGRPASWLPPAGDRLVAALRNLAGVPERRLEARWPEAARRTVLLVTPAFRRLATATAMLPVLARYPDLPSPEGGWLRAHRAFLPGASDARLRRPASMAWSPAVVVEAETAPDGRPRIVGNVAGIPEALVELYLRGRGLPPAQSTVFEVRRRMWVSRLADPLWAAVDPAAPGIAAQLVAAGDALFDCARKAAGTGGSKACRALLRETFGGDAAGAWLRSDAAAQAPGPLARFQAGWALGGLPAARSLPGLAPSVRAGARGARGAAEASGELQRSLRAPAPVLFGQPWRALALPWPHGMWFRREASVAELAERELADLRVALLVVLSQAGLPPSLATELGLLFVDRICASVRLPTGWDGESVVHFLDRWPTYLPEDVQHAVHRGWLTVSPEP